MIVWILKTLEVSSMNFIYWNEMSSILDPDSHPPYCFFNGIQYKEY